MRIDIIEVNPTGNKIKKIVLLILIILFIISFGIFGMYCAKKYKNNVTIGNNINSENVYNQSKNEYAKNTQNQTIPIYSEKLKKEINNIYNQNSKIAFLTFDDGPSQAVTPLILDVLKQENIKATFFVLGVNVKNNPSIVKRAYTEGHYIANHGYSHNYSKIYKNAKTVLEEYNKTEEQIRKAIENEKYSSQLFRFPGGFEGGKYDIIKKEAGILLNKNNISYIDWNVLTGDAQGANTKEKILKNIEKHTKNKGNIVVLMHDSSSKILTYETLKEVIDYLRNQGYTFKNFYDIMN